MDRASGSDQLPSLGRRFGRAGVARPSATSSTTSAGVRTRGSTAGVSAWAVLWNPYCACCRHSPGFSVSIFPFMLPHGPGISVSACDAPRLGEDADIGQAYADTASCISSNATIASMETFRRRERVNIFSGYAVNHTGSTACELDRGLTNPVFKSCMRMTCSPAAVPI